MPVPHKSRSSGAASIFEVAKKAGVSIATVSRVLSRPEAVRPQTRRKVLQAVAQLGYATNIAGKQLRTQRSGKLLVIVPDIMNPFYSRVLQSIEETAQREGYAVLLGDTQHDPKREERYFLMSRSREADGIIMLGHGLPDAVLAASEETANRAPVVIGCELARRVGIPSIHIDNERAAHDAMEHLYSLGHRRIGIVTGPMTSALTRDRLQGVAEAARAIGAERDFLVVHGDFTIGSGEQATERLLSSRERPTAIFYFNDLMAIGGFSVARQRGLCLPDDLSVIGCDDILFASYTVPRLTTIAQPVREMGQEMVRVLLELIKGQTVPPVAVTLPHRLIVRASTAPAAK